MNKSIANAVWVQKECNESLIEKIAQEYSISKILANLVLLVPNLNVEDIPNFLNPKIKNTMPNPNHLMDMQKAVDRFVLAIQNNEKITIFGDYDVDGATSSAIISNYLQLIGIIPEIYIPDRFLEGYGPNVLAMENIAQTGTKLLITVDCGTVAFAPLEKINSLGVDTIVIDHHLGVKQVPTSVAVVNPNRYGETTHLKYLCGAGVSFMMIVALNARLREMGFFKMVKEPNIIELLPLVALGTVCDVMKLEGLNRAFVKTGLEIMNKTTNIGLKALKEVAGIDVIDEHTLGFVFGPCINAGGRIGNSKLGAMLLSTKDEKQAKEIATQLFNLNIERRQIEDEMKKHAIEKLDAIDFSKMPVIIIGSPDYHQGVIGILASRLKEKYNRPAIVYSALEGYVKASARSIVGIDIGGFINYAVEKNILLAGGGHEMAGGFSCEIEKLEEFENLISKKLAKQVQELTAIRITEYSCEISLPEITMPFYQELERLRPFGISNFKPVFVARNVEIAFWKKRGEKHLFAVFVDEWGASIKGMFFGFFENHTESLFTDIANSKLNIMFQVSLNNWNGSSALELNILDIQLV